MKLFKKLLLFLGGSALAVFFLIALIMFIGISGNSKFIRGSIVVMQESLLKHSARNAVLGDSAYLEEKINSGFSVLDLILTKTDPGQQIRKYFAEEKPEFIDYILVERKGRIVYLENPSRKSAGKLKPFEHQTFLHQIKESAGTRNHCIFSGVTFPGILWMTSIDRNTGNTAVIRLNGAILLNKMPSVEKDLAALLVWNGNFTASLTPDGTPELITEKMENICRKAEHKHTHRLISNTVIKDDKGILWTVSSANLFTRSGTGDGLHVIHARRSPEELTRQLADISDGFSGILLLLTIALVLGVLIFTPFLLVISRHLSAQVSNAAGFAKEIFQSEKRPRNLELKFSSELEDLTGSLNLLRDKLNSALSRLSRSHERELRAKQEAEESNILRSGLLTAVLAEVRDPLSRIDGFSRVISQKDDSNGEISNIAELIRLENRAMISVFRALSDLTSLDSDFCELGSYQIEPSEIIRDAISDLSARAAKNNITLEIRNIANLDESLMTSPSILTHTVYTAAATLIRFMPENTTLRISSERQSNALVFRFSDEVSEHLSIAEVFRKYTETGRICEPHCAVAVLNLLILKNEAEFLGADVRIEKNDTANSMIEIIHPLQTFNPAVTGVFTRPKLVADPDKIATAARFHVAGIASVSLSGRDPFRAGESIGAVFLANMKEPDITLYRMLFEPEGFTVASAGNEMERAEYIRNNRFDLVFLDMTLEDPGNLRVISEIRKSVPPASVLIVLTDSRKVEYVETLLNSGADYCFRKPVVVTDLLFAINKLKNGRRDFL